MVQSLQVTGNGTIFGIDDHLSAPFRRAQELLLPGCMHSTAGLPIATRPEGLGVMIQGWGENAASPIRDKETEALWFAAALHCSVMLEC
jgi:hypothetical protein